MNILENAIIAPDLNAYERSTMFQLIGQYLYETGRPNDAQQAFEDAIVAGGLSPEEVGNISVVIAQLKIGNGQFREGAEALEAYLASGGDRKPQYIDLLVNAWVQAEDYERALPWAEEWFESAEPKERKHFDLLNFLYRELGMTEKEIALRRLQESQ